MNMSPRSAALALSAVAIAVSLSVSPALAVELAPGKARTVALFRRESGALEDTINGKRPAAVMARGFVLMRGGVPLIVGGHVLGVIGVSTDTPDHDEQIAKAGAAAFAR
jgi:glc operon protein GlcG